MEGTRGKIGSYKWSGREKGGKKMPKTPNKKIPQTSQCFILLAVFAVQPSERERKKKKPTQNKQLFDTRSCFALKNTETHFTMEVGIP